MSLPIVPMLLASAAPVATGGSVAPPPQVALAEEGAPALPPEVIAVPAAPDQPVPADAPPAPEQSAPLDEGVIVVEGQAGPPPGDPAEEINAAVFGVAQSVDEAVVGPVAEVYEDDIPKPLRNGLRNFLRNLMEPVNALNFLLQLKPGKAFETLGRFAINTTVGIGGLLDVASRDPINLPWRRNGLSNTLGYYGVGPGPYFYLPLIGATTLRDLTGTLVDQSVVPFVVGAPLNTPYYAVPAYTINSLQSRMEFDETLGEIRESFDPYTSLREYYLCRREAEIEALHNRPPPRDCRIAALNGELDEEPAAAAPVVTPEAAAPADSATVSDAAAEPVALTALPVELPDEPAA